MNPYFGNISDSLSYNTQFTMNTPQSGGARSTIAVMIVCCFLSIALCSMVCGTISLFSSHEDEDQEKNNRKSGYAYFSSAMLVLMVALLFYYLTNSDDASQPAPDTTTASTVSLPTAQVVSTPAPTTGATIGKE